MSTLLKQGMQGADVVKLQKILNDRLALSPNLNDDGIFGPNTHRAVVVFQLRSDLAADGVVGSATWGALVKPFFPAPGKRRFDRVAAVEYARKHAKNYNSQYPRKGNDCTSFVSQVMRAGGWTMAWGTLSGLLSLADDNYLNRKSPTVWWFIPVLGQWSYSWGGVPEFTLFLTNSKRGTMISDRKLLVPGDVVSFHNRQTGRMRHVMVVTRTDEKGVFLSGHTNELLDEPLSAIENRNPDWNPVFYKIADVFE